MSEPLVRDRDVVQLVVGISEHQARAVYVKDRVSGLHDLMQRIFDTHLAEAQFAQLGQGLADVLWGYSHLFAPRRLMSADLGR
jgi:hypothetical protein